MDVLEQTVVTQKDYLLPRGRTWLTRRMALLNLTSASLASRAGISTKHLSQMLNGKVPMSEDMTLAIAAALDVDVHLVRLQRHDGVVFKPLPYDPALNPRLSADYQPEEPMDPWFTD